MIYINKPQIIYANHGISHDIVRAHEEARLATRNTSKPSKQLSKRIFRFLKSAFTSRCTGPYYHPIGPSLSISLNRKIDYEHGLACIRCFVSDRKRIYEATDITTINRIFFFSFFHDHSSIDLFRQFAVALALSLSSSRGRASQNRFYGN